MIKIKIKNLILLLSFLNKNLNSMQKINLEDDKIVLKDSNSLQINDVKRFEYIKQNLTLLNLPEEIIQLIINKIIEPYIEKIRNIDNIFKLYSIDMDQIKKGLKKELINLSSTSKRLRYSVLDVIKNAVLQIRKATKEKEKELKYNIISKYRYLDIETLNNKLKKILNQNNIKRNDLEKAIKLIIAGADINLTNEHNNETTLIISEIEGYKDIVELLLNQENINVNLKNKWGQTALMAAIKNDHQDIVKSLLDRSADINARDNVGWTTLMWAIIEGHKNIVELLLSYIDIDINLKDNYGYNALIWAVIEGNKDIVESLLNRGTNINAKDNFCWTALMWATIRYRKDIVELLLNNGADINAKDNDGNTALILAKQKKYKDIVKLIESKMIKKNSFCIVS